MTVTATSGSTSLSAMAGSATTSVGTSGMDKDTFLKLLVAQMKYQDPEKPADSGALVTQTATYSQVETMQKLTEQNAAMLALQRASSAGALVGKTATYVGEDGVAATGRVSSVILGSDSTESTAVIDGQTVAVGRITAFSA
ncbi:flagellar hook assembly protein FlgD [Klenkia taihuensis]|jgi:flagellar basal-body rod modification protein FlgD|uniref:Flagellar basal-body rod modification protein FlgD n=1 Tax=Klenkia taihuensis TaxID=1225127 RepID=A0A1I1MLV6_9ACTN|nr:flagellar hook capping FlgD N-terminal domain-containing protein [Klenkia taihuensis]GHE14355.1 flagellar basal body rod modification protein FlgD [Klenkia taihuensis]SFC86105.1 flagellar basal-body rod modification protein FlgD [Klenkia taihuensis]